MQARYAMHCAEGLRAREKKKVASPKTADKHIESANGRVIIEG
jgi:hypothetical protein